MFFSNSDNKLLLTPLHYYYKKEFKLSYKFLKRKMFDELYFQFYSLLIILKVYPRNILIYFSFLKNENMN